MFSLPVPTPCQAGLALTRLSQAFTPLALTHRAQSPEKIWNLGVTVLAGGNTF